MKPSKPLALSILSAGIILTLIGCSTPNASTKPSGAAPTASARVPASPLPSQTPIATPKPSVASGSTPMPTSSPTPVKTPAATPDVPLDGNLPPERAKDLIAERTKQVIAAIKNKDMKLLASYVHPELGVRFTPYTHVDNKKDLVIRADQLEKLFADKILLTWGDFDGSGEPIKLTFADYYAKFVYNQDFANPEKISYNDPIGEGNTANNIREVYPTSIIVEYYFSGFDPKLYGNDWASLKLVFQHYQGQWRLVGLIHDQWTI